jgi:hypothetical protein
MLPFWLEEQGGKVVLIPERAAAVRRIFELSAAGYGEVLICQRLNTPKEKGGEGVPAFGPSGRWNKAYVSRILRDRRAVGEYQPRRRRDGKPDGEAVPNYYPAVVTEQEWEGCRGLAAQRKKKPGRLGEYVNLFQGLLKDARTGGAYFATSRLNGKRTAAHRVLMNNDGHEGKAPRVTFPADAFERAILALLREVDPSTVTGQEKGADEVLTLSAEHSRVDATIALLMADLDAHGDSPALYARLRAKEREKRALAEKLATARQKAAHPRSEAWGAAQTLIGALDAAPDQKDARLRLRSALRHIIDAIWLLVVPRGRDRLCAVQVFFGDDGCRSYLLYHKPTRANGRSRAEGGTWARSFKETSLPEDLDLRSREDASALEKVLLAVDVDALLVAGHGQGDGGGAAE